VIDQTLLTLVLGSLIAPLVLAMVPRILEQRRADRQEWLTFIYDSADTSVLSVEKEFAADPYRKTPEGRERREREAIERLHDFAATRHTKLRPKQARGLVLAALYKRRAGLDGREAFAAPPSHPSTLTVNTGTSEFRGDTP
jgi:hypothetical protein